MVSFLEKRFIKTSLQNDQTKTKVNIYLQIKVYHFKIETYLNFFRTKAYNAAYSRLDKEKMSSGESDEEMELFVKSKPKTNIIPTIEKVVEEGDTLQSLAIRYGCTVSEFTKLILLTNLHIDLDSRFKKVKQYS